MHEVSASQLKALLDEGKIQLLDVRQPEELEIARIEGAINIPLNELPARVGELDKNRPIIAFCHHGVRSEMAIRLLQRNGFADFAHLSGGIDAWSQQIDPSVPRY
jgi:rhodanese-related sulfurtransferase